MSGGAVEVAGRRLPLSNLAKVLYPSCGFTKGQVVEYYGRIAPVLLPHLRDRPLTLKRYPDGVDGGFFFEKRCPSHRPAWVPTAEVAGERGGGRTACLVNDPATLLWVANLATLELHVPLDRAGSPGTPDAVVFDLDPGEGADVLTCARVALTLRDLFARLGLASVVKTSGLKGLHVYLPLNRADTTFADTKAFSKAVALVLQRTVPDLVTSKMAREERAGRVFLNWSQNDASKTMVCAYSLRAREEPLVSCPLSWEELERRAREGDADGLRVGPAEAVRRAGEAGDLFAAALSKVQELPHG